MTQIFVDTILPVQKCFTMTNKINPAFIFLLTVQLLSLTSLAQTAEKKILSLFMEHLPMRLVGRKYTRFLKTGDITPLWFKIH